MRKSHWRTTILLATALSVSAGALSGCSTGNAFKMPSSDWLSWGKKKPSNTAVAARSPSNLPAPPSSAAAPHPVPSYLPGAGSTAGSYASNSRGPGAGGTAATPASYGGLSPNPAAPYNAGPGTTPGSASAPYGGANASQGFYSPEYRGTGGATAAANAYSGQPGLSSPPPAYGGDAYGTYSANGAMPGAMAPGAPAAPSWGQTNPQPTYQPAPNAYGQAMATAQPGGYAAYGSNYADGGYAASGPSTGASYGENFNGPAQATPIQQADPSVMAAGAYRPGSTARNTQFGTNGSLSVPPGDSVQAASFAGAGQNVGNGALSPATPGSGVNSSVYDAEPAARTATGDGGYPYNSSYQR